MINPTGYTALDLVGFTDKGTYVSNENYIKNDIVHYGGNLWRCKIDDTMNVTPGENNNWTVFVGEPTNLVERIIAPLEDNPATVAYATGRQIIYDDWLWEVIDDIAVGDPLIDYAVDPANANIKKAVPVETQLLGVKNKEGSLTNLHTTSKTNLVAAINEVKDDLDDLSDDVGTLSSLSTTDKSSTVAAINEVKDDLDDLSDDVGTLSSLSTTDKSSTVAAINEVNTKVAKTEVLIINIASFSSLPQTASNANIESDMVVVNSVLGTPSAQTADWTVTTSNGSLTISGTSAISGSTTATLYLMKSR